MPTIVPSLSYLRRKANMSQYVLAKQVGVTEMSISNYESGRNAPSARILIAIAKALNVTVDDLLATQTTSVLQPVKGNA